MALNWKTMITLSRCKHVGYWIWGISLSKHLHNSSDTVWLTFDFGIHSFSFVFGKIQPDDKES